jgi:hypothetical protein
LACSSTHKGWARAILQHKTVSSLGVRPACLVVVCLSSPQGEGAASTAVMSRSQHQELNATLNAKLRYGGGPYRREEVWEAYQEIYAKSPEILEVIRETIFR